MFAFEKGMKFFMDEIQKKLLKEIADIEKTPMGAYNIWIFSLI